MENLDDLMENVHKVELIVDHGFLESTLIILDGITVSGYTVIEHPTGKGDRGLSCDDFDCMFNGTYIMTVCTEQEQLDVLIEQVKPILQKSGGICLITQAKWLKH